MCDHSLTMNSSSVMNRRRSADDGSSILLANVSRRRSLVKNNQADTVLVISSIFIVWLRFKVHNKLYRDVFSGFYDGSV